MLSEYAQILNDAVEKADKVDNTGRAMLVYAAGLYPPNPDNPDAEVTQEEMFEWLVESNVYRLMIFHRDFAAAIFGEESVCPICGTESEVHAPIGCNAMEVQRVPRYDFHRREMIVEDHPLLYMREFIYEQS